MDFRCGVCYRLFPNERRLETHVRAAKCRNRGVACDFCGGLYLRMETHLRSCKFKGRPQQLPQLQQPQQQPLQQPRQQQPRQQPRQPVAIDDLAEREGEPVSEALCEHSELRDWRPFSEPPRLSERLLIGAAQTACSDGGHVAAFVAALVAGAAAAAPPNCVVKGKQASVSEDGHKWKKMSAAAALGTVFDQFAAAAARVFADCPLLAQRIAPSLVAALGEPLTKEAKKQAVAILKKGNRL